MSPAKTEPEPQKKNNDEKEDEEMEEEDADAGISYTDAAKYWESVSPTIEGMLGGFGKISPIGIVTK